MKYIDLTDYSAKQLYIFSGVIAKEITELTTRVVYAKDYIPEGEMLNDITRKDQEAISELREFHVHLLTALQLKKELEKVEMN